MTRWKRILINLLLPAPIGLVFVYGLAWVNLRRQGFPMTGHIPTREDAREGLGILIFAYLFAIIPSILFTLAMEWLYKRRSFNPGSGTAVSASTLGGTLSALAHPSGRVVFQPCARIGLCDGLVRVAAEKPVEAIAGSVGRRPERRVGRPSDPLARVTVNLAALSLVIGAALIPVGAMAQTPTASSVLAENRAATESPQVGALELRFGFAGFGMTGTASRTIDLSTGAYFEATSGGPVTMGSGFDGRVPWMRDFSGAYTPQEGGDRVALATNQAYRLANAWWRPDFGGAEIAYLGREASGGALSDHLKVAPKGGKPFEAWFDARSHFLARVQEIQGFMLTQTLFTDYARIEGVMLPRTTVMDLGAGPPGYITLTLQGVQLGAASSPDAFRRPMALPDDAAIDGGAEVASLPFRLLNNHIYIAAFVDGKGPYTFIVDTGGHLALSPRLAAELGAEAQGDAPASGAGEKIASTAFASVSRITLGKVTLRHQTAFVMNVYDTAVEGIPVDGMVGFELFRRFVVQIDYGRQTLTFFDPVHFRPVDLGVMTPFVFYDHLPEVTGMIDGVAARFDIDTGSRSELDVTSPFVRRTDLHAKYPDAVEAVTGWGVGGPITSNVVRLASLTLGGVRVDGPIAELSDDAHGSFSDSNYDGNIGSALLKRFVVTLDYAHQRLYLRPPLSPVPDVGTFDRSGLWFNATPSGYIITALDRGGPAEAAGLLDGDVMTAIDGRAARMAELSDARLRLRTLPAGTAVRMDVERGADRRTFAVRLRDLVSPETGPSQRPSIELH